MSHEWNRLILMGILIFSGIGSVIFFIIFSIIRETKEEKKIKKIMERMKQ